RRAHAAAYKTARASVARAAAARPCSCYLLTASAASRRSTAERRSGSRLEADVIDDEIRGAGAAGVQLDADLLHVGGIGGVAQWHRHLGGGAHSADGVPAAVDLV